LPGEAQFVRGKLVTLFVMQLLVNLLPALSGEDISFQKEEDWCMRSRASSLLIACSPSESSGHPSNSRILLNRANSKVFGVSLNFRDC